MNEVRELSERQARLEGVIEQLDRRLDSIERRFDSVERRFDVIERRIIALETSIRQGFFWLIGLMFTSWLSIVGLILWKLG
ncbi:MAG: hypothetical protein OXU79_07935 [Gemmatimonadota bacterium]|nr:hypothetical protein [Gemmatimonadota bacterium]